MLVTALLTPFSASPPAVFVLAMAVCGTLEYLTSYAMEKLFHARWWDYSHRRFNLNGRVCAGTLIPFGLMGLGMVYVARPVLFGLYLRLPQAWMDGLCLGLCALLLGDTVLSATILGKIRKTAEHCEGDSTEALTQSVREALIRQGMLARRALRAFPYARLYNRRLLADIRARRAQLSRDLKARRQAFRDDLDRREARLREELETLRNQRRHGA